MNPNIILGGFMLTGKTTIGELVARRLGRPFIDMDAEIERRAAKPIARIFAEEGEPAFRQMEAGLCAELSRGEGLVIAAGGGALVDPANRELLAGRGVLICLTCSPDELVRRLDGQDAKIRPLLNVADRRAEIERLLAGRQPAYDAVPWQVDTGRLTVEQAVQQVVEIAGYISLTVQHPGGSYPIHVGLGMLQRVGRLLRQAGLAAGGRVALVSNPVVAPLYAAPLQDSLSDAGLLSFECLIPDGEEHKTLAAVASLYDQFLAGGLDRSGVVLALGGGVTGDIAGMAAATFMRGVRFAQLPTTLLAMVDASVGGKTGVDLPQGKNLVGAFIQPLLVAIDPSALATLPPEELRSGMAEVIKHGLIGDAALFADLEQNPGDFSTWWGGGGVQLLAQALRVKVRVVEQDPFEHGLRAVLNLGHTAGHAIEKISGYRLRHGEAVSIGMVAAARIAAGLGLLDPALAARIENLLQAWGLPARCPPFAVDDLLLAMAHDKKKRGLRLRWALPVAIGRVEIHDQVPPELARSVLCALGARG